MVPLLRDSTQTKECFMSQKQPRTWGIFIIQLSLAIYFVVTAILLLAGQKLGASISSQEVSEVAKIFSNKTLQLVLKIAIAVVLLVYGVVLLIKAFGTDLGKLDDVLKIITLIVWIAVTVIALVAYAKVDFKSGGSVFHWFLSLAKNGLIIGGIVTIKNGR